MTTTVIIKVLCPKDREICVEVTEPDRYGGDYSPTTLHNGDEREYTVYGDVHAGDKNFRWIRIYERKYLFGNNAEDLQQIAYGEYIMEHCAGDRVIGNGHALIKAKEEGYLWDDFLASLDAAPLEAGYEPAPCTNPECPVRNFEDDERAEYERLKVKYKGG